MPQSLAISIPTPQRFEIAAISVVMSTLLLNRLRRDSAVILQSVLRIQITRFYVLRAGTTPILEKTLRECRGKWKSFICYSENGIFHSENHVLSSESCSENTLELSQSSENGLFTPRAFFLKLRWSPGQEAAEYLQKGCSRKMPPSFPLF